MVMISSVLFIYLNIPFFRQSRNQSKLNTKKIIVCHITKNRCFNQKGVFTLCKAIPPCRNGAPLSSAACNITPIIGDCVHKCVGG